MSRMLTLAGLGLLAACLTLATPTTSNAQSFGFSFGGYAPTYGYGGYGGYGYQRGYYGYGGYAGRRYHRHGYGRPVIVHPEYSHWTPYRGWHTHGHVHVPHRGHYHTRPY